MAFTILDLTALTPLDDQEHNAKDIAYEKNRLFFQGKSVSTFYLPTSIAEGTHPISPPIEFESIGEILVPADISVEGGKMCIAILACDFSGNQVTVLPQKWFNEGDYDFGYQWIARVQREPISGQIVGEGMRLSNFKLDTSGMRRQERLPDNVFYDRKKRWL